MKSKRRSVHAACRGVLSIDEAAELLRVDRTVVEEAGRQGELPTVQLGGHMYIDGPALLSQFSEPVLEESSNAP